MVVFKFFCFFFFNLIIGICGTSAIFRILKYGLYLWTLVLVLSFIHCYVLSGGLICYLSGLSSWST